MMRGLYFKNKLELINNYPIPIPLNDEALVRITMAGICSTDIEIIKGYMGFSGILGHEFVGIVEKCHDKLLTGKRVVGDINISCGQCLYCRNSLSNHCPSRSVLGILNKDGAYASKSNSLKVIIRVQENITHLKS